MWMTANFADGGSKHRTAALRHSATGVERSLTKSTTTLPTSAAFKAGHGVVDVVEFSLKKIEGTKNCTGVAASVLPSKALEVIGGIF